MVSFNDSLSFEIWFEIHVCGLVGLVVLTMAGEYLEWRVNCNQKGFVWMRHNCFVDSACITEIVIEVLQLKEHSFGCIGYRCNEKWKSFSDV